MDLSSTHAIVGAWREGDTSGYAFAGKAYIYDLSDGSLTYTLDNPSAYGTSQIDHFGEAVAISNNYAIVGAYQEDDAGGSGSGKAYIFDLSDGSLAYTLDNPNPYGTSASDGFGFSTAISDTHAIVGARNEDDASGDQSGKAYIYDLSDGSLLYTLDNPNPYGTSASDYFGEDVALTDTQAMVSAFQEGDAGGTNSGKVYIYNLSDGSLAYTLDNPNAYGTSASDSFARQLAASGSYIIAGAYAEDDAGGNSSGKAYIYNFGSSMTTNLTSDNYIGFAGSEFSYDGALGQVITGGGVVTGLSGLVVDSDYYVQNDGSISTTVTDVFAGTATSTTTLELPVPVIPISWGGDRGIVMGGRMVYRGTTIANIDYFDITNPVSNATNFGSLISVTQMMGGSAVSNKTRVVTFGGAGAGENSYSQYITVATPGNATTFGNFQYRSNGQMFSDGTLGVYAGGATYRVPEGSNNVEETPYRNRYSITIDTLGNASGYGNLSTPRYEGAGFSDGTYGLVAGGQVSGNASKSIEYMTIATRSAGSNFGDLLNNSGKVSGCANHTYGMFFGGSGTGGQIVYSDSIEYVTVATPSNSTAFGNLTQKIQYPASSGNATRAVRMGGKPSNSSGTNTIDYWEFDTPGAATDFGNLTQPKQNLTGSSGDPS